MSHASSLRPLLPFAAVILTSLALASGCRSASSLPVAAAPAPRSVPAHHVVPLPSSITPAAGAPVTFSAASRIVLAADDPALDGVARLLAAALTPATGYAWPVVAAGGAGAVPGAAPDITLALDAAVPGGRDAYRLDVTAAGVRIVAATPEGVFRGTQTLRQLLPPAIHASAVQPGPWRVAPVSVTDAPRYQWRGAMLDVARHFFGPSQVKRYIDLLAFYKFNVLHLHLSDDQGWRIEILSWPRLATWGGSSSVKGDGSGFFTQAEYRDIVAYASARFITVIPEIDMPGHTNAALASYPELNCNDVAPPLYTGIEVGFSSLCVGREVTYRFVDDVVRELAALTPGPYIHIGGDEVKKLTAAEYAGFIERAQEIVARHGKRAIGWDEIAHARLAPTTVVQQWRVGKNGVADAGAAAVSAVAQGARLVMSPASKVYLDMKYTPATVLGLNWAGYVELRDTYAWDPGALIPGVTDAHVLGVEAPLWTETIVTMSDLESMVLPRLLAVADVGWAAQASREWNAFTSRVAMHGLRWDVMGVSYYRSPQVEWMTVVPTPPRE